MKIKKPVIIPMFKCSSGPPVESLPLWKTSELMTILRELPHDSPVESLADFMLENAERFVQILWLKEKGRPNGAKDRKPRVKRTTEAAAAKAA